MMSDKVSLTLVYIIYFLCALIFSILINRLFLKFAKTLGIRNLDERVIRWSSETKPSVGGISFYIIFLLSVSTLAIIPVTSNELLSKELIGLLLSVTLGFIIGLADDAYDTNPILKFFGQFTCANILVAMGVIIEITPYITINYFFTTLWVIGIMNSLNMLDNMDGITASVSLSIILSALIITFLRSGLTNAYTMILLGVGAALIGFLYFNWAPAKMYMGDTGSQFLGIFLAAVSILFFWNQRDPAGEWLQLKQFLVPLVVFLVPIIDTLTVTVRRILKGQSPFIGGKDHITHHLAYLGLPDGKVSLIFAFVSFISVGIMYFIVLNFNSWTLLKTISICTYIFMVFILVQLLYERGNAIKELKEKE